MLRYSIFNLQRVNSEFFYKIILEFTTTRQHYGMKDGVI